MSRRGIRILAAVVAVLVLTVLLLDSTNDTAGHAQGERLLGGFAEQANEAQRIRIVRANAEPLTIRRESERWIVDARDGYAADIGKLRTLIVALAEARIVEEKTANPALYNRLGVDDPENGGGGNKITVAGDGFSYDVILGNPAQGEFRYARLAGGESSYLIDRNPDLPQAAGDWLFPEVIDISADRMRRVVIEHDGGETITVEKSAEELTDFGVTEVPQGRELSYATVGNGIADALSRLTLDDVRRTIGGTPASTAVFETWGGLRITAAVSTDDDASWVTFSAESEADDEQANDINERLSGWQYRLPDYKKNLLTRRWDNLLKPVDETAN